MLGMSVQHSDEWEKLQVIQQELIMKYTTKKTEWKKKLAAIVLMLLSL